jgi:hypothetical protein
MRRFGKTLAAMLVASFILLGILGCLTATPQPTPTAIPLAAKQSGTQAPTRVAQPTPTELLATPADSEAKPTSPASAPEPPAAATPTTADTGSTVYSSHAETPPTPTPQPRIMALGGVVSVSLRSGPRRDSPLMQVVSGSNVLWVEAQSDDGIWSLVTTADGLTRAWALSEQLVLLGDPESLPVAEGEVSARPQATSDSTAVRLAAEVTGDLLNVRRSPGLGQPKVGELSIGDSVLATGRTTTADWLAIEWQDDIAWLATAYVDVQGDIAQLPVLVSSATDIASPLAPPTGKIVFQTRSGGDIWLVNGDGTGLRRLTDGLDPALSPNGRQVAFARWGAPHAVYVLDLASGSERQIAQTNRPRSPTWSPDGSRVAFSYFIRSYTCFATPFGCVDEAAVREYLGGEECIDTPYGRFCIGDFPIRREEETSLAEITLDLGGWRDLPVQETAQSPDYHPSWDELIFHARAGLQITGPDQTARSLVDEPELRSPSWSPDGANIVVQRHVHDHTDLFLLDAGGNVVRQLTQPIPGRKATSNVAPAWSADGNSIIFLSDRAGEWQLYRMNKNGSGQEQFLPAVLSEFQFSYDYAAERVVNWGR